MERYDLIIVGGGLVGAGFAVALAQAGLKIALIDARVPSNDDPRLFALNHSSCRFLTNLDLWPRLAAHAAPIHQVHVSYQHHFGAVRLNRAEAGLSALGHVIPARVIETVLNTDLATLPHCTVYRPARLISLSQQDNLATLEIETLDGKITLETAIVIGADGAASTVRMQADIEADTYDYEQSALVTVTQLQRSHQQIAYERFCATGAIAMLPLTGQACATIWSAEHAVIQELMALSDELFVQRLQQVFGYRLGRLISVGKRHQFPLSMTRAKQTVDQCVLLLGNAAHTLHPIAAQGFNLALYEVAALVEGILTKTQQQATITIQDLQQVITKTHTQQRIAMNTSHHLSRLSSKTSRLKNAVIPLGMIGLDLFLPAKKKFMDSMLGKAGQVPRLLLEVNGS